MAMPMDAMLIVARPAVMIAGPRSAIVASFNQIIGCKAGFN